MPSIPCSRIRRRELSGPGGDGGVGALAKPRLSERGEVNRGTPAGVVLKGAASKGVGFKGGWFYRRWFLCGVGIEGAAFEREIVSKPTPA